MTYQFDSSSTKYYFVNYTTDIINNNVTTTNATTIVTSVNTTATTMNDSEVNRQSVTITGVFFIIVLVSIVGMKLYGQTLLRRNELNNVPHLAATRDENENGNDRSRRSRQRQQENEKENEKRYLDIESLLINMYVMEHDDRICQNHSHHNGDDNDGVKCHSEDYRRSKSTDEESPLDQDNSKAENKINEQQQSEKPDAIGKDDDEETNNNDPIVCSICLDQFRIRDIVSISPSPHDRSSSSSSSSSSSCCHHVFHHVCIKEWLLRHTTCPTCRQEFVIDGGGGVGDVPSQVGNDDNPTNSTDPTITTISTLRKNASQDDHPPNHLYDHVPSTFYCVQHGIVRLEHDPTTDDHPIVLSPPPEELLLLRLHPTKRLEHQHEKQPCPDDGAATVTTTANSVIGEIESVSTSFSDAV